MDRGRGCGGALPQKRPGGRCCPVKILLKDRAHALWALERRLVLPLALYSIGSRQKGEQGESACLVCLREGKKVRKSRGGVVKERGGEAQNGGREAGAKLYRAR